MRRLALLLALAAGLATPAAADAAPALVKVGDFATPVHVSGSPLDSHRLFVVEQYRAGAARRRRPPARTRRSSISGADTAYDDERGLLSIAFPADYAVLAALLRVPDRARPAGQIQVRGVPALRDRPQPRRSGERAHRAGDRDGRFNHNGGQWEFGPDGKLWIGRATEAGGRPRRQRPEPGVAARQDAAGRWRRGRRRGPEICAIGLRNPWRFSFDRADRRPDDRRCRAELSGRRSTWRPRRRRHGPRENYGWPCVEGRPLNATTPTPAARRRPATQAAPRVPTRARLLDHRRLRRPRPGPADLARPLSLRRLLRRRPVRSVSLDDASTDARTGPGGQLTQLSFSGRTSADGSTWRRSRGPCPGSRTARPRRARSTRRRPGTALGTTPSPPGAGQSARHPQAGAACEGHRTPQPRASPAAAGRGAHRRAGDRAAPAAACSAWHDFQARAATWRRTAARC